MRAQSLIEPTPGWLYLPDAVLKEQNGKHVGVNVWDLRKFEFFAPVTPASFSETAYYGIEALPIVWKATTALKKSPWSS